MSLAMQPRLDKASQHSDAMRRLRSCLSCGEAEAARRDWRTKALSRNNLSIWQPLAGARGSEIAIQSRDREGVLEMLFPDRREDWRQAVDELRSRACGR